LRTVILTCSLKILCLSIIIWGWTTLPAQAETMQIGQVLRTNDGGFLITAYDNAGYSEVHSLYLYKTDGEGKLIWHKQYYDSKRPKVIICENTRDNGFILVSHVLREQAIDEDISILRLNEKGEELWQAECNGHGINHISETLDGGFILGGYRYQGKDKDAYVLKIDREGRWDFTSSSNEPADMVKKTLGWERDYGGSGDEEIRYIQQVRDEYGYNDGYILVGYTNTGRQGYKDVYVLRLDPYGEIEWERGFGGNRDEDGYYVMPYVRGLQDSEGLVAGFLIAGYRSGYGHDADVYLLHVNRFGELTRWSSDGQRTGSFSEYFLPGGSGFVNIGLNLLQDDADKNELVVRVVRRHSQSGEIEVQLISLSDNGKKRLDRSYRLKGNGFTVQRPYSAYFNPGGLYYLTIYDTQFDNNREFVVRTLQQNGEETELQRYINELKVDPKAVPKDIRRDTASYRLEWVSNTISLQEEAEPWSVKSTFDLPPPPKAKGTR
jgi:hypothetical protein